MGSLQNGAITNISTFRLVLLMAFFMGGITLMMYIDTIIYDINKLGHIDYIFIMEVSLSNILQLQFLYIADSINTTFKIIEEQLQVELFKIIDQASNQNIPLEFINRIVDTLGTTNDIIPNVNNLERQKTAQRICQIKNDFVLACEVLRALNNSDNILLFLQIISFTTNIAFTLYNIILLLQDNVLVPYKLCLQCVWFLYHTSKAMMVIEPCYLEHKIKKIRLRVAQMMSYVTSESDPILNEVDVFFKQLILNDVHYSALQICYVGRALIPTIIGTITTILITISEF